MKRKTIFIIILLSAFAPWMLKAQTETIDLTTREFANGQRVDTVTVTGVGCTIHFALGSNPYHVYPRYYDNGTAVRVYGGNTFTVTATDGRVISEIDFTFSTGGNSNAITASTGSYSSGIWTGSATEVTFQVDGTSGHRRLRQLVVTYESQVVPPTFNLYGASTTFLNNIQVRIEAESGATIRYTTDGSTPTGSSPTFVNNLTFYQTTTLKAVAIRDGSTSNVATLLLVKDAGLWSGTGIRTDPFLIDDTAKLNQLARRVNAGESYANTYFVVTADIAYACTTAWNDVAASEDNYTRIGTGSMAFRGHFDGNGHTISGIRMYQTSSYNYGLFGYIGSDAVVKNIVIEDCRFTAVDNAGAIAGRTDGGATVENCHVRGNVCIHDKGNAAYRGGVVGYMYGGTVRGCTSSATLSIDDGRTGWDYGGIAGRSQSGDIFNCLAIGVTLPDASHFTVNSSNQRPLGAIVGGTQQEVSGCLYYDCHFGDVAATQGVGRDYNSAIALQADLSHTLTCATEGVSLRYDDDDPNPEVVEVYPFGLAYGGSLYAAQGASVTFVPLAPEGYAVVDVVASGGSLTHNADGSYTLVMPAEDVTVSAILGQGSCSISYELHDSWSDSWNGAAIEVRDVASDTVIDTWTIASGGSASGSLPVNNGQAIRFIWVSGNYDGECSYTVYDAIGEAIFYGNGAMGAPVDYTVNCNICPDNHVLSTADITPTSAVINWPERAGAYNIRYRPLGFSDSAVVILTVGDVWEDNSGYQMLLDADHTAYGTIIPTEGGLTEGGNVSAEVYAEFEYKIPENADGSLTTQNIVFNNSRVAIVPPGTYDWCITNPTPEDRVWIASDSGDVAGRQDDFVFQAGHIYEFVVSLYGNNDKVDLTIASASNDNEGWTVVSGIHPPYTIADLSLDTWYEVQVQADCDALGSGVWNSVGFHTLPACTIPTELETTDILSDGATLNWLGYQDSYQVRYSTVSYNEALFFEGFEEGIPSSWTKIDSDGDGHNWLAVSEIPSVYDYYEAPIPWSHSGSDAACSPSYVNYVGAFNSDQWLITPLLELGGVLRFYAKSVHEDDYDDYEVRLSTTGTALSDFTTTLQSMTAASSDWVENSIDLSQYAGQTGYIAIHHQTYDGYFLVIDDFGIYQDVSTGDWQTVDVAENTLTISGLTANTRYQWQVQGVDCDGNGGTTPWSESAFFTTALPSLNILANQWYAIAAPAHDPGVAMLDVTHIGGLTDDHYDLFRYNEADGTWENQKASEGIADGFTAFDLGRGYIYRRTTDATLTFDGIPNSGSYSHTLTSSCLDEDLRGFNLIGNPYPHAIYKGVSFPATDLATGFYSLQTNGTWLAHLDTDPIGIGQGVLVQAASGTTFNFENRNSKSEITQTLHKVRAEGVCSLCRAEQRHEVTIKQSNNQAIKNTQTIKQSNNQAIENRGLQLTLSGFGYTDVAYALLSHLPSHPYGGLRKVQHLAAEAPAISIPLASAHYAIAPLHTATEAFPLAFSGTPGEYTITLNPIGSIGYCHLVDRATSRDVDLLAAGSYTFRSTGSDADRFVVRLRPEGGNGTFAYQLGDRIVVNGKGTLQVFDLMGRQLFTYEINSKIEIRNSQFPATGVYLLRMNGQSQKIVIY